MKNLRRFISAALVAALALVPPIATAQQFNTLPPNSIVANVTGRSAPGNALAISDFIKVLNLFGLTKIGDANYQINSVDRTVTTDKIRPFTAPHTWTLPRAVDFLPGQPLYVADLASTVTASNTLTIARSTGGGSDTINGGIAPIVINSTNSAYIFISDGSSNWLAQSLIASSSVPALTLKGNASATAAPPTDISVPALPLKSSVVPNDIVLIQDSAAANAFKRTTVGAIGTIGAVSAIDAATGAFTISGGLLLRTSQDLHVDAATKAQQQTGSSAATVVTPAHQQEHLSAAKAWVSWTASTGAILDSYNVASVSRAGAGSYTVNFTTPFANALYVCQVTPEGASTGGIIGTTTARGTTGADVQVLNSSFVGSDPLRVMLVCFGRQ